MPQLKTPSKGLSGWVHAFYAGTHTDKNGNTVTLTQDDLDDIVRNHTPVPHVIGHPEENHPAYAWTAEVKREGDNLFVKSSDINADFSDAIESKAFPNRSASLVKTDNGWKLRHIGWLGAVPPALEKLHSAEFSNSIPDGVSFEFSEGDDVALEFCGYDAGVAVGTVGRLFQGIRDFFIEKWGLEKAEQIIPSWELDYIQDKSNDLKHSDDDDTIAPSTSFSQPTKDNTMTTFTQDQLDDAVAKAKADVTAEFSQKNQQLQDDLKAEQDKQRHAQFSTQADALIKDSKLKPADKDAWVAFAMQCEHEATVVAFSQGDGDDKKEQTPAQWFVQFSQGVTPFLKKEEQAGGDDLPTVDFSAQAQKVASEQGISIAEAIKKVKDDAGV